MERAELARIDGDLEGLVGAARLGIRVALGDAGMLLLDQVAPRLVLAIAAAQRRARRAHERVGIERPLEQHDVAQAGERAARGRRAAADPARDEHDEGEVGPRRLARDPGADAVERRAGDERLLGHERDPGADLERARQGFERFAHLGAHALGAQHLQDHGGIAPARCQDEDALLDGDRVRSAHRDLS